MAITLIIEDGEGYNNSNSYVTVAEAVDYAAQRGVDLGNDDNKIAIMLIKAKDYLEAQRAKYQGYGTKSGQALQFPRTGVQLNDSYFPSDEIPNLLKSAQMQLVIELNNGVDIMPTVIGGQFIKREKIGPIETEYSETVGASVNPTLTMVDALLQPLYTTSAGFSLRSVRI